MPLEREIERGIKLSCKHLPAGACIPWHDHGLPTLCVVYSGEIFEEDQHGLRQRIVGDMVFRGRPELHRNHTLDRPARVLCLETEADSFDELGPMTLNADGPVVVRSPQIARLGRLAEMELRGEDNLSRLRLVAIAYELLSTAGRARVRHEPNGHVATPEWLPHFERRLGEDPDGKLSIAEYASELGLEPPLLARAFRNHYGTSLRALLRGRRIAAAMHALSEGARPLAEIAVDCGFYDQSHFTRSFKRATGVTPGKFRRRTS
jgi:AraC-like DNA-binding protein